MTADRQRRGTRRRPLRPRVGERVGPESRHRFGGLVAPLAESPSFFARSMFGCVGCYVEGRLVLVLADRGGDWQGLLVPVEREVQPALLREFPALRVHGVLPKWLYLPESSRTFEAIAAAMVARISAGDLRFGVEPRPPRLPRRRPS